MPEMPGEFAMAYIIEGNEDITGPAREVYAFQKKLDKKVQIVGGIFEGAYLNQEKMLEIAQIPGMLALRAQFVNLINSPIQRLVIGLKAIADKKA